MFLLQKVSEATILGYGDFSSTQLYNRNYGVHACWIVETERKFSTGNFPFGFPIRF